MVTTVNTKKLAVKEIVGLFESFKTSFVGLRGYTNDKGEVADVVINVGIKHNTTLKGDLEKRLPKIKASQYLLFAEKYGDNVALQAFAEKQLSMEKSLAGTNVHANGQIDAYLHVGNGIKIHIETGDIFIYGYVVSKKVLVKGVYPVVKSRPLTLCKKDIDKGLKAGKYRQYKISFDKLVEVVTGGRVVQLGLAA